MCVVRNPVSLRCTVFLPLTLPITIFAAPGPRWNRPPGSRPVGQDTVLTDGKERREFGGQTYVLESPLRLGKLIIAMRHCERAGQPKIVNACQYDVTGTECVDLVVTDLAVIAQLTVAPLVVDLWTA